MPIRLQPASRCLSITAGPWGQQAPGSLAISRDKAGYLALLGTGFRSPCTRQSMPYEYLAEASTEGVY